MQEKEMSTPFYPDITEDQAAEILLEAFEQDPKLQIITGTTHTEWDILVNYTIPKGEYREGELASLCMYWDMMGQEHVISQLYPNPKKGNDLPLRIFPSSNLVEYYTAKPVNWYQTPYGIRDAEIPSETSIGGIERVDGVLRDSERFLRLFWLYNDFFKNKKNYLEISKERLRIRDIQKIALKHFRQMSGILGDINEGKIDKRFFHNENLGYMKMYDHGDYICHQVQM